MASKQPRSQADTTLRNQQVSSSGQSDNALSQSSADQTGDGRFSVAEEVNLDQQSDKARQVGQLSLDWGEVEGNDIPAANAALKSKKQSTRKTKREEKLKQSINRAVPPSQ
ncbi:MAG TPA: hypothetical protein VIF82_15975 [Burkholderiaceae bacterium]|jgi:hypothetical protein